MMKVGSLFSGIGGFDLGLERAGMRIEWQVENNDHCREVLKKHWPKVRCHYDITHIDWRDIPRVDLVCGGFPCQPFSLAGKQRGKSDDRYLWPEVVRCLDALRPTWFLGENVPGIINLALDQVCADMESLGYTVWPVCVPACAVDAPHQRQRVWIVAHAERTRSQGYRDERRLGESCEEIETRWGGDVADSSCELPHRRRARGAGREEPTNGCRWLPEPQLGRVAHGIPRRVDRLRGLGNAVVPQVVEAFGRGILAVAESIRLSEEVFA